MTKTVETLRERVYDIVSNLDDCDLVYLYNEYCDKAGYCDDCIYNMCEFEEIMCGCSPLELANKIFYGDFCPCHDYFRFDGYANLESFDFGDSVIDIDELVDYIIDNEDCLYNDEVEEVLDEWEEEEEDEDE